MPESEQASRPSAKCMERALASWLKKASKNPQRHGTKGFVQFASALAAFDAALRDGLYIKTDEKGRIIVERPARDAYVTQGNQLRKKERLLKDILKLNFGLSKKEIDDLFKKLPAELGRTTRSGAEYAEDLLHALYLHCSAGKELKVGADDPVFTQLLNVVAKEILQWAERHGKSDALPLTLSERTLLNDLKHLIQEARARHPRLAGPLIHHLVGAKLALRYPELNLEPRPHTAADDQRGEAGDYVIGDAAFHVTVTPGERLLARCARNLQEGKTPWILVPENEVAKALRLVKRGGMENAVNVFAVERFVGQNLEEISGFKESGLRTTIARLVEEYNRRIDKAEGGQSALKLTIRNNRLERGAR